MTKFKKLIGIDRTVRGVRYQLRAWYVRSEPSPIDGRRHWFFRAWVQINDETKWPAREGSET